MPKLSVLMPVFNAEKFVTEAIDSILKQTFTDFEFLIIDDCSTDSSVEIIRSFKDNRIKFYQNKENSGISFTLNRGIQLASTDYIARMDADDISYPDRLQKQYDYMIAHSDCAMVSSLVRVISEEGNFIRQDVFKSQHFYYNLTFICWIYHPVVMYRKNVVCSVGMYTVPYCEDYELFWQITRRYKFHNIFNVMLDYRVTKQSLHQVIKKHEYAQAQKKQLLRNFRYYAGENYSISEIYIDCLQHNFEPLLQLKSVDAVVDCINELRFLSQKIIQKENINLDIKSAQEAALYKEEFIVSYFVENLSRLKAVLLLCKLKYFKYFILILKKYVGANLQKLSTITFKLNSNRVNAKDKQL